MGYVQLLFTLITLDLDSQLKSQIQTSPTKHRTRHRVRWKWWRRRCQRYVQLLFTLITLDLDSQLKSQIQKHKVLKKSIESVIDKVVSSLTKNTKDSRHVLRDLIADFEKASARIVAERAANVCSHPRHLVAKDFEELQTRTGEALKKKMTSTSRHIKIQRLLIGEDLKQWRKYLESSSSEKFVPHLGAEDTGCKTLASTFDVWNACVWYLGNDFCQVLERTSTREISTLESKRTMTSEKDKKERLSHRIDVLWKRLKRKRRAFHKEVACLYSHLFTHVLRPDFKVSHMTRRYRRLSARISRRMRSLSIYSFKCELERVSRNTGMVILTVREGYTSKICGCCGHYHTRLGGSKTFKCPNKGCKHVAERDGSAARKILILFIFAKNQSLITDASSSISGNSGGGDDDHRKCSCCRKSETDKDFKKKTEKNSTQRSNARECSFVKRD